MIIKRFDDIPFVAASHEDTTTPGVLKKVLFTRKDMFPGQVEMVNWAFLKQGKSFRSHHHENMLEVFVVTAGCGSMTVDGKREVIRKGDAVIVPPRSDHEMVADNGEDVWYIVFGVSQGENGKTVPTKV